MKKIAVLIMVIVMALSGCAATAAPVQAPPIGQEVRLSSDLPDEGGAAQNITEPQEVSIPDHQLYGALVEVIGREPIYQSDLEQLVYLFALNDKGITDLTGMEYCINLKEIVLTRNHVTDPTPLMSLPNLRYINLHGNNVTDLGPFAAMTEQAELTLVLSNNGISDISPLAALPNLLCLYLAWNEIAELPVLSNMTALALLDLRYNNISDTVRLVGMNVTVLLEGNPTEKV